MLAIAAGLLFGLGWGLVWATLGSVIGAAAGFLVARYVNGGLIEPENLNRLAAFGRVCGFVSFHVGCCRAADNSRVSRAPSSTIFPLCAAGADRLRRS